jgi:hypothetical protein
VTNNRQFSQALQALTELKSETSAPPPAGEPVAVPPTLDAVLAKIGPVPSEALLMGVASDGLPVLLNLYDPHPGPMLIAGDAGSGKTAFLQTMAHSVARTHAAGEVRVGVITNYPDEWESVTALPHHAGVFAVGHKSAQDFIHSLAAWAHANKRSSPVDKSARQCLLLLVDDLESVASLDLQAVQDFRWLLLRGPARHVWPIVTLNAPRYGQVLSWLQNFRTRVFGHIANERVAEALGGAGASGLSQLEPRIQFSLRERENWLRFWLPSCLH